MQMFYANLPELGNNFKNPNKVQLGTKAMI